MTRKEKIDKAWELVNSKHIETNNEIQLVRFAVRTARELVERDIKVYSEIRKLNKLLELYRKLITVKDELISIAWFDGSCDETEEMEADLKKRIKELENDK